MYTGVAAVSFILNTIILIAYWKGVKQANAADKVAGYCSHILLVGHIVVWVVSAGIYRYGKEPVNGKFRDLWGWSCSTAADEIQAVITDVNFGRYCNIQMSAMQPSSYAQPADKQCSPFPSIPGLSTLVPAFSALPSIC